MKKKIYITTPIFYVNDSPHIGHSYTSIICDTLARFYRLNNFDVLFTTGTDEHGLKVEKAAKKSGMTPNTFVDMVSKNFSPHEFSWQNKGDLDDPSFVTTNS